MNNNLAVPTFTELNRLSERTALSRLDSTERELEAAVDRFEFFEDHAKVRALKKRQELLVIRRIEYLRGVRA